MKPLTPLHIRLLLQFFAYPDKTEAQESPAGKRYTQDLLRMGLITPSSDHESGYAATDKGCAHVTALCHLKLPVQTWTTPPHHEKHEKRNGQAES